MRNICMEVAGLLEEVACSGEDQEDEVPERILSAERFAAAVQASLSAAESLGVSTDDDPSRLPLHASLGSDKLHSDSRLAHRPGRLLCSCEGLGKS